MVWKEFRSDKVKDLISETAALHKAFRELLQKFLYPADLLRCDSERLSELCPDIRVFLNFSGFQVGLNTARFAGSIFAEA